MFSQQGGRLVGWQLSSSVAPLLRRVVMCVELVLRLELEHEHLFAEILIFLFVLHQNAVLHRQ